MAIDRNEQSRQEFAAKQQTVAIKKARESFAGDFQLGRAGALDRFGNMVREGDHVVFRMPHDPVMTVLSVSPSMDPTHPVGAIKVVLACEVPVMFGANQPSPAMIRVGSRQDVQNIEKRVADAQAAAGPHNGQETEQARDVQSPTTAGSDGGDDGDKGDDDDGDG